MPEPLRPVPIKPEPPERLESWKEIAAYLGREVRTVQLWEKNEGLPVHRLQHGKQGSVHAFRSELDAWRDARKTTPEAPAVDEAERRPNSRLMLLGTAALVLITVVSGALIWALRRSAAPAEGLSSIVVLPFLDLSPQKTRSISVTA